MDETNNLAPRERINTNSTEALQHRSPFLALDLMPREPHLLDYLLVLRKHQWLITFFLLAVVSIVTIATFRMQPIYEATAKVEVDRDTPNAFRFNDSDQSGDYFDLEDYIVTQSKILQSETLAMQTVKSMGLDHLPQFGGHPGKLEKPEPAGNDASLREPPALGAFLGAAATIAAVYFLGRREGQIDSSTLLLAGIISASFLSAIILFLMTTQIGRDMHGIAFWIMGDLSTPLQQKLRWVLGVGFIAAAGAIYTTASDLNLLLAGEKEAMHLGVDVPRVHLVVYIAASVLTGLAVSVSGAIGYVGLLVPHVMRFIFGSDHRMLLPAAAFGGAIAVVIADTLARTVVAPAELPVGVMTAMAGAPLFIYLLRRRLA